MHKRAYVSILILLVRNIYRCLHDVIIFYGFTFDKHARDFWRRGKLCVSTEREGNLYFRNVTRCCCKIWNINASRHSHNRPRTNWAVRSILFFISMRFLSTQEPFHGMVPASFLSKFSPSPPPPPLSLSLFLSLCCFSSHLFFRPLIPNQNGSRGRNRCYYNAAASSQSLIVEVWPSFNILRSVSMSWSQSVWTAKRAGIARRLN